MARRERDKGASGEREVAEVFTRYGFTLRRVPNSGGLFIRGDLLGLEGYHVEVKRQERADVPGWLAQAYAEAPEAVVPVVAWRRSQGTGAARHPAGEWHAIVSLDHFAALARVVSIARDLIRDAGDFSSDVLTGDLEALRSALADVTETA